MPLPCVPFSYGLNPVWAVLKVLGGLSVGLALVLVVITLFIAIGLAIRTVAIVFAIVGTLGLIGILFWMAIDELVLEPRRKRKSSR